MLNAPTINQTHYVIYEIMQFDALYSLDKQKFYRTQSAIRRDLLEKHFRIFININSGRQRLIFSAVSAPHPYSIDTYPLAIECSDGRVIEKFALPHPTDTKRPISDRAMLFEETGLSADGKAVCKVFALYAGRQITLFETSPVILNGEIDRGRTVPHTLFAQFDAVSLLDAVYVEPERRVSQPNDPSTYLDTQGRVKLVPVDKFRIGEFIGVNFETDHSLAIGIAIESNGKPYFRYYPKTPVGKNVLVLVSPVGFDGGENIKDVDSVTLFIYTDKQLERSYEPLAKLPLAKCGVVPLA